MESGAVNTPAGISGFPNTIAIYACINRTNSMPPKGRYGKLLPNTASDTDLECSDEDSEEDLVDESDISDSGDGSGDGDSDKGSCCKCF